MAALSKIKYRIMLVQRTAYDFNVKANSDEEACKILERELRTHHFRRAELNQVVKTIDAYGGTNAMVYNNLGKQQNVTDALGNTTQYGYDAQGRLTQTIYADGTLETSAYDAAGNRTNSLDRAGQVTAKKGSKRGQ